MFSLHRPPDELVERYLEDRQELPLTYGFPGVTRDAPPRGWTVDHNRIRLGVGDEDWRRARRALGDWRMFDRRWLEVLPTGAPIEPGGVVGVVARAAGLWTVGPARIVYVVDEDRRFGFAYGTLPGHAARGEERFLVERDGSGEVWFDLLAISRPSHPLFWVGFPLARRVQRRFGRDAKRAMVAAVSE